MPKPTNKPIDLTLERMIHSRNATTEREKALIVLDDYARFATEKDSWSNFKLYDLMDYDDTDGSGMHENRPGVEGIVQVTAPSGQVYKAGMTIDEEAHNPIDRGEFPEDYIDDYDYSRCFDE